MILALFALFPFATLVFTVAVAVARAADQLSREHVEGGGEEGGHRCRISCINPGEVGNAPEKMPCSRADAVQDGACGG